MTALTDCLPILSSYGHALPNNFGTLSAESSQQIFVSEEDQQLSVHADSPIHEQRSSPFYALAQDIFKCSAKKRTHIYQALLLNETEQSSLKKLHRDNPLEFLRHLEGQIQCYADLCFDCQDNVLSLVTDALRVNEVEEKLEYHLDANFQPLREVAQFIHNRDGVRKLASAMVNKKRSAVKRVLRQSGKLQHLSQVNKIADAVIGKSEAEICQMLFHEFYHYSLSEAAARHELSLKDFKNPSTQTWSIEDPAALDAINDTMVHHIQEVNRDDGEKTLDQLCQEYALLNSDGLSIPAIKSHISNIRLYIEDLKNHKALPDTSGQAFPLALIAEICVAIEKNFNVMLRDSQLLAILNLLDSGNVKGSLLQVKTGEGKSYIIAALAIIKSKQGHEVDIITSSATLAKRDLENFKSFYQQFGISAAHNCEMDRGMMANPCYQPHSIVYGTPATFEGDGLRAEFYQAETFNGRKRGIAILDEADSMLLDKSSWLCQISDSVAGMSTLRPMLYYIWALVNKKIGENTERKLDSQGAYDAFLTEIRQEVGQNTQAFFSTGDHGFAIPQHLQSFVQFRIPYWVDSAINAIIYSPDREYNADEHKITPIDNANTGEWEKDVQWEDGLHQFLHMKHGLGVATETLTKSFMSNHALVHKYESIYGLSGTLGDEAEAKTLSEIYGVATRKIPTFKESCFAEKPAWISSNQNQWLDSLYTDVVMDGQEDHAHASHQLPSSQRERQRASLIICNSIGDVKTIQAHFQKNGISATDIVTYTNGDEDREKIKTANKGKIIIATNLSGRGTDINAEMIEAEGGLHVIFSFLPSNRRIQDQGFGRTSRTGRAGTGRLIIKTEELRPYHMGVASNKPLLDVCNNMQYSNLQGAELNYNGKSWKVESDHIGVVRTLKIKTQSNAEVSTIQLAYDPQYQQHGRSYNRVRIDGATLQDSHVLQYCLPQLTYDSIMGGRDRREQGRLEHLRSHEQGTLIARQLDFEAFQKHVHSLSEHFQVDPRLNPIKDRLLEIYKSYLLDEWATALDRMSKTSQKFDVDSFVQSHSLNHMIQENDLYKMQYINASIDVDNQSIRDEALQYYSGRAAKMDMTAGFAAYNRVFVQLRDHNKDISLARASLERAQKIFEEGEQHEMRLLQIQHKLTSKEGASLTKATMEGTPMLRLILTMKSLVKRNLDELGKLSKDYSKMKVSFTTPNDLKEKPTSSPEKKDGENGYTIPDELMQDAIKLGLKGCLKLEGEGTTWLAILLAVVCVLVAIAAIAAVALSGGLAAPLVGLLGGKLLFGVITGAVIGGAISGAINAIKGAVKGDFSASKFGKDLAIGLAAGAVGGAIGAGLASASAVTLQTAGVLMRTAIHSGIGAVAGAGGAVTSYLVGAGVHGNKVTAEGLGKSALGGVASGFAGGVFSGFIPHGSNNVVTFVANGAGAPASNAVKQGVDIAFGDQEKFDEMELLESSMTHLGQSAVNHTANKFAAKSSQKMTPISSSQAPGEDSTKWDKIRTKAARGSSPERIRANRILESRGHPPVQALPKPDHTPPVPSSSGSLSKASSQVVKLNNLRPPSAPVEIHLANIPLPFSQQPSASVEMPHAHTSLTFAQPTPATIREVREWERNVTFKQDPEEVRFFINGPVRTTPRHPLSQNPNLHRPRSMDDFLNVLPNFQMHADGRAVDNQPPQSISPMEIYKRDEPYWYAWYRQHKDFFIDPANRFFAPEVPRITKFDVMVALALWEKWKNEPKVMQQLVNEPNDKKLGIARVHFLEGHLEGYCSIDVSPIRGYPGEWRLLCELKGTSKSKTDFSRSRPIALVDTHRLLARHNELQGHEGEIGVVQIKNLGTHAVQLNQGEPPRVVAQWYMRGVNLWKP